MATPRTLTPTPRGTVVLYLLELHDVGYGGLELVDPHIWGRLGGTHLFALQPPSTSRTWTPRRTPSTTSTCLTRAPSSASTRRRRSGPARRASTVGGAH